jgi:putative GTP pyrophosphokinase
MMENAMSQMEHDRILAEFNAKGPRYTDLASMAKALIEQLLAHRKIAVHSVTCRPKDPTSLARKLLKPERTYLSLEEITDLAGVRVTTYFEPDVDRISKMIEEEFQIDKENSTDKRLSLDSDRFGYLSVHYVLALTEERADLPEYERFSDLKFELQIRSILQHAWAEIEHDLGYKSTQSIPHGIRRRFSRIAGLLELADAEFAAIRDELTRYEELVPERIEREPERVAIDLASLSAFITSNRTVRKADAEFAENVGAGEISEIHPYIVEQLIGRLRYVGLNTIAEIEAAFEARVTMLLPYVELFPHPISIFAGWTLIFLPYFMVAESNEISRVRDFVQTFNAGDDEFAETILSNYQILLV